MGSHTSHTLEKTLSFVYHRIEGMMRFGERST
nr:MAG TPA: hypothetical protein [Caudoviricetes sp.]